MASLKPRNSKGKIILEHLTKELFQQNIVESRKCQGESVEKFSVNKSRCRLLSKNEEISDKSNGILYWMSRDCRVQDNWALLFAQRLALKQKSPLYVCFVCKDVHHLYPTKRHFAFLIEGLKIIQKEFKELNIGFYLLNSSPKDLAKIIINNDIGAVVCDFSPLKVPKLLQQMLVKNLPKSIPVVQVDAHNIVPAWEASDKQEIMAKFIRSKIIGKLPEYLTGFPEVCKHKYSGLLSTDQQILNVDDAYAIYTPKWEVPEVKWGEGPGSSAGLEMLRSFIQKRLKFYGVSSNDPSKDSASNLSPWLHFGHISAQRCALEVKSVQSLYKEHCERFLEQLIIRKELTDNYCLYNNNYDNLGGAANWAQITLKNHEKDKRTWTYTREQLANAKTHDEMWNAAQLQAIREGKIHGYMRMYWCKKILEWTESPEQAIEYSLWLNDTFCLDGTDPNGYVGIMWSICGLHDHGWTERRIFGKIRYMVDYSLRRKYDMEIYCTKFGLKLSNDTKKRFVDSESSKDNERSNGKKRVRRCLHEEYPRS